MTKKDRKIRRRGDGNVTTRVDPKTGAKSFYAQWSYKDADGQSKRTGKRFKTEDEAYAHLRKMTSQVDEGAYFKPAEGSVSAFFDAFMASTVWTQNLAPQTRRGYRRHIEQMKPRIGHLPLGELSAAHLDKMYAELLVSGNHALCCKKHKPCGSHKGSTGLSRSSVRHYHNTLCTVLKYAVEVKAIPAAVTAFAHPPTPKACQRERKKFQTWTGAEVRTFLTATKDTPLYPIWHLLLTTGCRRGEILGVRWDDLDLDAGTMSVVQTVGVNEDDEGSREVIVQDDVKGGDPHMITLDAGTLAVLREHRKRWVQDRLQYGDRWQEHGLVFYRGMGTGARDGRASKRPGAPLDGERISTQWREQVMKVAGLTKEDVEQGREHDGLIKLIRLHDTRHTWATLALKAKVDIKIVQERLNHSHTSITQMLYQHVDQGMDAEAAEAVAAMFA